MSSAEPDPIERAFARVYEATTATLVTPDVDVIIGRARRRRTTYVVVASVSAIITVALGVAFAIGPLRGPQTQPAVTPSVSPTPSPTFTVPEGTMLVDPTGQVPAGFLDSPLLVVPNDQNGEDRTSGFGGQCGGAVQSSRTLRGVTGAADAQVSISLDLYLNEDEARTAFADIAPDLVACLGFPGAEAVASQWPPYGDESTAVTFLMPRDGAGELTGMPVHAVAVRVGRTIETFISMPRHGDAGIVAAATPEELDALVIDALPRLCVFTACPRTPELPTPLGQVSPGGRAWLVVLYVYEDRDDSAKPGQGLLAAALAGYRPVLSFQGCDVGAEVARPGREQDTRYLALYFAEQGQAEAAADAVAELDIAALGAYPKVFEVQTRCAG